jgi:simple sugar transport system permease protein
LFEQDFIVYLTPILFLIVVYVLTSTNFGLRLRAVGENPEAADAAGISVAGYRFFAIMAGAMLLGLAGGYITIAVSKIWVDGVTGGRGWIAVALVIFARWYPWRAFFGALLFGSIEALIPRMAAAGLALPQYFVLMLPYAVTLAVMIWTSLSIKGRQSGQPSALGEPFVREQRR